MTESASDWSSKVIDNILTRRSPLAIKNFRSQPLGNKIGALEKAVVQPRYNDTADKVTEIVKDLVELGAIKPEEAGPIFSDLLIRVHKYNGSNVQNNLDVLLDDIRAAHSESIRSTDIRSLSNQVVLNDFLAKLPVTVPSGQHNYDAFKMTLRLFCNEAPNSTVFKSGLNTMLQVNIVGVNTVNLNEAFTNLQPFWGIILDSEKVPTNIMSKLSANSRVLMLMLAPFTNDNTFTPDSLIAMLMSLYRDTVSASIERPEETESEVMNVASQMGNDALNLSRTLGYLIKSKESAVTNPHTLSPRQVQVLRYIQESLADRIDRNGEDPSDALDNISLGFAPSFYENNGAFIRRLITYLRIALNHSPSYFREIYSNKYWHPPQSFWSRDYSDFYNEIRSVSVPVNDFSHDEDDYQWDDFSSALDIHDDTRTPSMVTAPSYRPSSVADTDVSTMAPSDRTGKLGTFAKAIIPPLATTVSEYYVPGLSGVVGPIASALTSSALSRSSKRALKRAREKRAREAVRLKLRKIREANDALEEEDEFDDVVIPSLTGDGVKENTQKNIFSHLAPKRGMQM
uniref:PIIIa n=1 Tax=Zoothera dauma adenovirus TaxID=3073259 RepID=A0AA51NPG0_9ADEN|nr:pIIIa [Zoothera dauma adenovirus]